MSTSFLKYLTDYQTSVLNWQNFYPVEAYQGTDFPFVLLSLQDVDDHLVHGAKSDWGETLVRYEFFTDTFAESEQLARIVRDTFEGKTFDLFPGVRLAYCKAEVELDFFRTDEKIYRRTLDMRFKHIIQQQ